ncbi:unnamed protein product [Danaus chrysippus]|uniref:(African queen) hypothetical protein n=1 Tax=Danaus chrysippus TaxID=151541 RepID=A0A8J2WAK7_9NEOP|nr:unnamed protein product [Danaus chrysippus]
MIHKAFDLPIEGGVQGSAEAQRHHPQHVSGDAVYVVRDRECRARRDPQVTTEKAGPRSSLPPYSSPGGEARVVTAPRAPCGQLPSASAGLSSDGDNGAARSIKHKHTFDDIY